MAGLINRTTTWQSAMNNVWNSVLDHQLRSLQKMLVNHFAHEAAKTGATATGNATRNTFDLLGATKSIAISAWKTIMQIGHEAALAAAGAYAALAGIPGIGPFIAPAASAAALAAVLSLGASIASAAGGWGDIPQDQMAMVHKNEMILPASIASPLRASLANGGAPALASLSSGGNQGGGDTHIHFSVNAMDAQSFKSAMANGLGKEIVGHLQKQRRNMQLRG